MNNLIAVPFRGAELALIDHEGQPFVAMRPVVEGMGLAWQPQLEKLKGERFASTVTEIVTVAQDGKPRAMTCLPLRKFPGWLTTISPNKVSPQIRDNILMYQMESDDALWDYWNKGVALNPRAQAPDLSTDVARLLMIKEMAEQQMAVLEENKQLQAENQHQALKIDSLTSQFMEGETPPAFAKRLNGVNIQLVNARLRELGWLYDSSTDPDEHHYRAASYARDRYLTESPLTLRKEGKKSRIRYSQVLLMAGAERLFDLYLKQKLPMKNSWDGRFSHVKFPRDTQ